MKNDTQIKKLLKQITDKKNELGDKPRSSWKTNGVFKDVSRSTNINTINSIETCVNIVSILLGERESRVSAAKYLDLPLDFGCRDGFPIDDWLSDFKLRSTMILWDKEKKKLKVLESKLKDLRSEDAKTEDALADIMDALK